MLGAAAEEAGTLGTKVCVTSTRTRPSPCRLSKPSPPVAEGSPEQFFGVGCSRSSRSKGWHPAARCGRLYRPGNKYVRLHAFQRLPHKFQMLTVSFLQTCLRASIHLSLQNKLVADFDAGPKLVAEGRDGVLKD